MTLVNTDAGSTAELVRASSPAARGAEFTRLGRAIGQIAIPVSAGGALAVGPPNPCRLLLTRLTGQLKTGQVVTLTLTFARAGQVTLRVPVIG
jgi:copper(I)-binding protein